jgi:glycosyltransferase involved in cell wall biosynthesis
LKVAPVKLDNDAPLLLDVSRLVWRRWSGTRATGIDRICQAWLEQYASQSQAVIIHRRAKTILPMRVSQALFRMLLKSDRSRADTLRFRTKVLQLGLFHGAQLRDRLDGRGRVWLNAGHTGLDVPGLADWCRMCDVRPVYLIHDLIPITHPEFCREGEETRHRRRMGTVLATAAGIVANSQHTLDTYAEFADSVGAQISLSAVAWPGTPHLPRVVREPADDAAFVVLGTIEGRKNHRLLLSIWQDLVHGRSDCSYQLNTPKLIIVGRRGWAADDVFDVLDRHDFRGRVDEAGALDDTALASVLSGARALLFPSFAEGFGIPLVEALAAGVPVIGSDLPVFREIGQGVPDLLCVSDQQAWAKAIRDYADPASDRRAQQLVRISRFRPPTWGDHFKQVNQLLAALQY